MKARKMISELDKKIVGLISKDIPLVKEPFKEMACALGIEQRALLERIRYFKRNDLMRRFSAILNHKKIGFRHNAMVVWNIPERLIDKAGNIMASFGEVSHCYQRKSGSGWKYNLYSMIHGRTKKGCLRVVREISNAIGKNVDHMALFSSKEEKKIGARYET